jgi:hypothetical protein
MKNDKKEKMRERCSHLYSSHAQDKTFGFKAKVMDCLFAQG